MNQTGKSLAGAAMILSALTTTMLEASATVVTQRTPAYIASAIADPGRPQIDTKRDDEYKPAEVIAFAGVKPGSKIADFMAGDDYYSRIFSKVVGTNGHVYAYYATDETPTVNRGKVDAALSGYNNVAIVAGPAEKFVTPERLDIVWTALTYHDMFQKDHFNNVDVAVVNTAIFESLKPGGIYFVIDRASKAGAGLSDVEPLFRIDEAVVKSQIETAGFKLVGESIALRNPADNHTTRVGRSNVGANPDRFILKFQKARH
jgi:predicted methyltransferase